MFQTTMRRFFSTACLSLFLLVGTLPDQVAANGEHGVTFLFPVGGKDVFQRGDTVRVSYITPFEQPRLYTWCMASDTGPVNQVAKQMASPFNSSELVLLNFSSVSDCWFNLRPGDVSGYGANSDHFSVQADLRPQETTFGLGVQVPSVTATSSPTSISTATPSVKPDSEGGKSKENEGLSGGAIAGICVGTVGLAIALGSIGVGCYLRRRKDGTSRGGVVSYSQAPGSDRHSRGEKFSVNSISNLRSSSSYRPLTSMDGNTAVSGRSTPSQRSGHTHTASSSTNNMNSLSEGFFRHETGEAELRSGGFGLDGSMVTGSPRFQPAEQVQQEQAAYEVYQTLEDQEALQESLPPQYQQTQNLGVADVRSPGSVQATPIGYVGGFRSKEDEAGYRVHRQEDQAPFAATRAPEPAELPSRDAYRGYGQEYEMPVIQAPSRFQQPLKINDMMEQKVLLPPGILPHGQNGNLDDRHRPDS